MFVNDAWTDLVLLSNELTDAKDCWWLSKPSVSARLIKTQKHRRASKEQRGGQLRNASVAGLEVPRAHARNELQSSQLAQCEKQSRVLKALQLDLQVVRKKSNKSNLVPRVGKGTAGMGLDQATRRKAHVPVRYEWLVDSNLMERSGREGEVSRFYNFLRCPNEGGGRMVLTVE